MLCEFCRLFFYTWVLLATFFTFLLFLLLILPILSYFIYLLIFFFGSLLAEFSLLPYPFVTGNSSVGFLSPVLLFPSPWCIMWQCLISILVFLILFVFNGFHILFLGLDCSFLKGKVGIFTICMNLCIPSLLYTCLCILLIELINRKETSLGSWVWSISRALRPLLAGPAEQM